MNKTPTNIRWRIFLILALASFLSYVLRTNVSIAAPAMIIDLDLNETQFGWILAAFATGYAIFQLPGGILGDIVGPRKVLAVIIILWSIFTLLTAVTPDPETSSISLVIGMLVLARFLVGASHAPIFPVLTTAVSRWFPSGGWALPLGLSSTALTLGAAASAPLLPWLIAEYGWRASFFIISPLGIIVAAIWWWYARDFPDDHKSVNHEELRLIRSSKAPIRASALPNSSGWIQALKNRDVILLMFSYSCMNFVFFQVFNWFYYYLVEVREFDAQTAGYVISSQWIAGSLGATLGGWLCDRLCKRIGLRWGCRWPIISGMVISAILLIAGAVHANPIVAVTLLAFCFFFNQLTEGSYWATSIAIGGKFAGTAGGIMNTGANIIGIFNALLVPWFAKTVGWTFAIASGAGFALIGAGLLLFVRADQPMEITETTP